MKKSGKVFFFNSDEDYGKIKCSDGLSYKFKLRDVVDKITLNSGTDVSFVSFSSESNKLYARQVEKIYYSHDTKQTTSLNIHVIKRISNWSQEAKKEEIDYFYQAENLAKLEAGEKNFVIGRKGTGKTAICEYLSIEEPLKFAKQLSFKNFPFNALYKQDDNKFRKPNQYITIWKYIIYLSVLKMMKKNNNLDAEFRSKLDMIFDDRIENNLQSTILRWVSTDFKLKILDFEGGISLKRDKYSNDKTWIEQLDVLEEFIYSNIDDRRYYVLFDELDEDYISHTDTDYFNLLNGLFKATMQIRDYAKNNSIIPIVFLRDDIYAQLNNQDKHKWEEKISELKWGYQDIQKMLSHRLNVVFNNTLGFKELLKLTCGITHVNNSKDKRIDLYDYISERTLQRPRDYVYLFQQAAEDALHRKLPVLDLECSLVSLSKHIKQTLMDEIHPQCNNISLIFNIFSKLGKHAFSYDEFSSTFNNYINGKKIELEKDVDEILQMLYRFTVIGNQIDNYKIFYESESATELKTSKTIILNKALHKALKIVE